MHFLDPIVDPNDACNNSVASKNTPLKYDFNLDKKSSIVTKSQSKELTYMVPKRAQIELKSVINKLKPNKRYAIDTDESPDEVNHDSAILTQNQEKKIKLTKVPCKISNDFI